MEHSQQVLNDEFCEDGVRMVMEFMLETLGVDSVEAQAVVVGGQPRSRNLVWAGMRQSFMKHGLYHDHVLWSFVAGAGASLARPQQMH